MFVLVVDESTERKYPQLFTEDDYCLVTDIGEFEDGWPGESQGIRNLSLEDFLMLLPLD